MASFKDSLQEGQTHIKSKAAVAWGPGEPLKMEEVDVELPKKAKFSFASLQLAYATLTRLPFQVTTQKAYFLPF